MAKSGTTKCMPFFLLGVMDKCGVSWAYPQKWCLRQVAENWWFEFRSWNHLLTHSVIKNCLVNLSMWEFSNLAELSIQVVSYIYIYKYIYIPTHFLPFADFWGWCTHWLLHFFLDAWDNHQILKKRDFLELVLWNHEVFMIFQEASSLLKRNHHVPQYIIIVEAIRQECLTLVILDELNPSWPNHCFPPKIHERPTVFSETVLK